MSESKQRQTAYIAEIDMAELTLRLAEAACQIKRPQGMSSVDALAEMKRRIDPVDPFIIASFNRAAQAAAIYITECIGRGRRPS